MSPECSKLQEVLYPGGTDFDQNSLSLLMEQYKLFVETSESLVARRQTVNTFFLSINGLLLGALGALARGVADGVAQGVGLMAASVAGILLCWGWCKLVASYRQLNTAKFALIHLLEEHLPASLFKAEWVALGEGKEPARYVPFTKTESVIPKVFAGLYIFAIVAVIVFWVAWDRSPGNVPVSP